MMVETRHTWYHLLIMMKKAETVKNNEESMIILAMVFSKTPQKDKKGQL